MKRRAEDRKSASALSATLASAEAFGVYSAADN